MKTTHKFMIYRKIFNAVIFLFLFATLQACSQNTTNTKAAEKPTQSASTIATQHKTTKIDDMRKITLTVNGQVLTATLENNSSADALIAALQDGAITIKMNDYENMEKVGRLGRSLPTNNQQITTEAGDLILYMGNYFVIYYDSNAWSLTRLGKIQGVSASELKKILGKGDVTVTLSNHNRI